MQFESDGESVQIVGLETVNHIAELTATDPESVSKSLLYRTVATGGGEVIEKGHTEQQACFGRDAFAKVLIACPRPVGLFSNHAALISSNKAANQDEINGLF